MCMIALPSCVCVVCACLVHMKVRRRVLAVLEMELETAVSCHMGA